jgi:hypothetical protein
MNVILESLGRNKWTLQTIILFKDPKNVENLEKYFKFPITGKMNRFYSTYAGMYFVPDGLLFNSPSEYLALAAKVGNVEVVEKMIKRGAPSFDEAIINAARNNHQELVERFIALGATNFDSAMYKAARNNHQELVERFISLGATDFCSAMVPAAGNNHQELVERFIVLGAKNFYYAMINAASNNHQQLVERFQGLIEVQKLNQ